MGARGAANGLAAVLVLLSTPPLAAAEPPPLPIPPSPPRAVRLDYLRGPGADRCPEEQDFRDAVGAKVTRSLFTAEPPPPERLVVSLGRRGAGYEGTAELYNAEGVVTWVKVYPGPTHRPAATCEGLIDALALCLAIEVDPLTWEASETKNPVEASSVTPPVPPPVPAPAPPPPLSSPPLPPFKRRLQLVVGLDAIFTPLLAPSASAGFALWTGVELLDAPLSFEVDLRSSWSVVPARVPISYQPRLAVSAAYVAGVVAGCWRGPVYLCPVFEVGRMSYSEAGTSGVVSRSSIVAAAGGRVVYEWPIAERFFLRGLFEAEGLLKRPFSISDEKEHLAYTPSPVSITWAAGFGGSL